MIVEIAPNVRFHRDLVVGAWPCPGSCGGCLVLIRGVGVIHVDALAEEVHENMGWTPRVPDHYDLRTL